MILEKEKKNTLLRHNWKTDEIETILTLPFSDLLFQAQTIHRENFDPNNIQISTLLSIKTGGCPEDCDYCPQSAHHDKKMPNERMMDLEKILEKAKKAKASGATRFCMGGAWRALNDRDMKDICPIIKAVSALGLETCLTAGMLKEDQAKKLKQAGLDYYNHNLDTSEEFYPKIISTRTYQDRLQTLNYIRDANIKICSGGIIGLGETLQDRANLLRNLANLPQHPESVPVNLLIKVKGTPLENNQDINIIDFIRIIAAARIMMPKSYIRLAAGRENLTDEAHALCFMAGANSIFKGEKLLTASNSREDRDNSLLKKLGINKIIEHTCYHREDNES